MRNDSIIKIARVESTLRYDDVLAKLSLPEAAHPSPPYDPKLGNGGCRDKPRQWKRWFRKKVGLPASEDVAALIDVVGPLVNHTNHFLHQHDLPRLQYAFMTTPFLPALYTEDLLDALAYLKVEYLKLGFPYFRGWGSEQFPVSHLNSAYAGSGLGLCEDFLNSTHCAEQLKQQCNDDQNAFVVQYTGQMLTAHVLPICYASHFYAAGGVVEPGLGSSASFRYGSERYWELVRHAIRKGLEAYYNRARDLTVVVGHGESIRDELFQLILKKEVRLAQERNSTVKYVIGDEIFAASMGMAELGRRAMMLGWNCFPGL